MPDTKWNVLVPSNIKQEGVDRIEDIATITSADEIGTSAEELRKHVGEFNAIILRTFELPESVLSEADRLKVISKHGVGLDNVDIEAASERGIIVCNTPGTNARAVAEQAICLLFATNNDIISSHNHVRAGKWERNEFLRDELSEKTIGIYGCGNIGRAAARIADGIGLECIGFDPYVPKSDLPDFVELFDSKSSFFTESDVVSVHTPLTPETRKSIAMPELEALGESGLIINTARGEVIDEDNLVEALEGGVIKGAGLDTFEQEPPRNSPLLELDNVVLSPHVGGATHEARTRTAVRAAENVLTVYEGGIPESTVNRDELRRS